MDLAPRLEPLAADAALVVAAQNGDRHALERLVGRHLVRVERFARKLCGPGSPDVDDVTQDTFVSVVRTLRGFRGEASVPTWLYTLARSHCIKRRRLHAGEPRNKEALDTPAARDLTSPELAPDERVAVREVERVLGAAMAALSRDHRQVLLLRDVEGRTAPEVAHHLGIDVGAVKSRLHRARSNLRRHVEAATIA